MATGDVNLIEDIEMNGGSGVTNSQMSKFTTSFSAANMELMAIGIQMTITNVYPKGSDSISQGGGLQIDAGIEKGLNIYITDELPPTVNPDQTGGVCASKDGVTVVGLGLNQMSSDTLGHEMDHVLLGDVKMNAYSFLRWPVELLDFPTRSFSILKMYQYVFLTPGCYGRTTPADIWKRRYEALQLQQEKRK